MNLIVAEKNISAERIARARLSTVLAAAISGPSPGLQTMLDATAHLYWTSRWSLSMRTS